MHEQTWSRWAGGTMSFGPVGRVLTTLAVVLVALWLAVTALLGAAVWLLICPMLLRSVWKPVRTDVRRR